LDLGEVVGVVGVDVELCVWIVLGDVVVFGDVLFLFVLYCDGVCVVIGFVYCGVGCEVVVVD